MNGEQKQFLIAGLTIALAIAVLAPFLASPNPDGLDSTAEKVGAEEKAYSAFQSPMGEYLVPFLGGGKLSGVMALIIGVVLIAGISYGAGLALKKKKQV